MRPFAFALAALGLMASVPVSAQDGYLRLAGAEGYGCKHKLGQPDCRPDRMYSGRSVAVPAHLAGQTAYPVARGYNNFAYGQSCLRYGYPPNCAYWELPDWNGGMEIRNPGGG